MKIKIIIAVIVIAIVAFVGYSIYFIHKGVTDLKSGESDIYKAEITIIQNQGVI